MSTLTARQELAGMLAASMFNGTSAQDSMRAPDVARVCVREALVVADEIIHQTDSQSGSDQSEMARTIQRLEHVNRVALAALQTISGVLVESASYGLQNAAWTAKKEADRALQIAQDAEAAK